MWGKIETNGKFGERPNSVWFEKNFNLNEV